MDIKHSKQNDYDTREDKINIQLLSLMLIKTNAGLKIENMNIMSFNRNKEINQT